jgi:hypothetical protein
VTHPLFCLCVFVCCNSFGVFVKLPNVGAQGSGDMPLLYLELYIMKNIESKGNFSIERMDEWVVAEIFHWVGDVHVYLLCCNFVNVL